MQKSGWLFGMERIFGPFKFEKVLNDRFIGVGIFIFILSVTLIVSGILINKQVAPDPFYPKEKGWQEEWVDSAEGNLQDGILRSQRERAEEMHQEGRKIPLAPGLLFLLLYPFPEEKPDLLSFYSLPFFLLKNLPVVYHSLRI